MWDNPSALNRLSGLLLIAALAYGFWLTGRAALETLFPVRAVSIVGAMHPETRQGVEELTPRLLGGFFSIDLEGAHAAYEQLPWVRQAEVRRIWPNRLEVRLEEHRTAAAWNDRAMLNTHGEVFPVAPIDGLPRLYAPDGMEREVARRFGEFSALVAPLDTRIERIVVSARQSWRLRLSDGISVELGRERLDERLARFVEFYPRAVGLVGPMQRVDMRYPNGFAGEPQTPVTTKVEARQAKPA